jgi:putative tryptophan/tyrosine transport system substrate-binding protein
MKRREFIAGLGGAAAWPLTARGQEVSKVRRVGYVAAGTASTGNQFLRDAFLSGMRELGYVEGQNFHFEVRFWGDDQRVLPDLVKDLVRAKAEVIVAPSSVSVRAAEAVAPTTPIVFIVVADPVGSGDIVSFARPQTNATGITAMTPEIAVKRLELLKEAVPAAARIAVLSNSTSVTAKARHRAAWPPAQ